MDFSSQANSGFKFQDKIRSNQAIIIGIIVALLVAGAGFWFWGQKKDKSLETEITGRQTVETSPETVKPEELQENVGSGLGASIYEKSQNPIADKLSETNPFGKTPINPLKAIYANPFE